MTEEKRFEVGNRTLTRVVCASMILIIKGSIFGLILTSAAAPLSIATLIVAASALFAIWRSHVWASRVIPPGRQIPEDGHVAVYDWPESLCGCWYSVGLSNAYWAAVAFIFTVVVWICV